MTLTEIDPTEPRHGGNASSAAAFESGQAHHQGERERIFAMISASPAGMTSKEIGERLGKALHKFSGRITQLKQTGLVIGTGVLRDHAEVLVKVVKGPPVQLEMWRPQ